MASGWSLRAALSPQTRRMPAFGSRRAGIEANTAKWLGSIAKFRIRLPQPLPGRWISSAEIPAALTLPSLRRALPRRLDVRQMAFGILPEGSTEVVRASGTTSTETMLRGEAGALPTKATETARTAGRNHGLLSLLSGRGGESAPLGGGVLRSLHSLCISFAGRLCQLTGRPTVPTLDWARNRQ